MKTIAEKLADLQAKLSKAKSQEEIQKLSDDIFEILEDSKKVLTSLKEANKEAKNYREKKEEFDAELSELKKKTEKENEETEDDLETEEIDKKKKTDDNDEMPAWAKKMFEKVNNLESKSKAEKRQELINSKLKEKKIPTELSKFLKIDGDNEDDITKAVGELEQTIKDNKLLSLPNPEAGSTAGIADEMIKNYAKSKDGKQSKSNEIKGKKIE